MKPWQRLTDIKGEQTILDEMYKKYKGTILGITDPENPTFRPRYGYYMGTNDSADFHVLRDANGNKMQLALDTNYDVFIPDPPRGLYNTATGAVLFYRKPFRQHKRGLGDGTAMVEHLDNEIQNKPKKNYFDSYIFSILENQSNQVTPLEKAFLLADAQKTAAITREFAISLHTQKETGYNLYYENKLIGDITDTEILLGNAIFYQEIVDTQYKWCPNHKVRIL